MTEQKNKPDSPRGRVWDVANTGENPGDLQLEQTCLRCGYSESFDPRGGDRLQPNCPKCGYDGTD